MITNNTSTIGRNKIEIFRKIVLHYLLALQVWAVPRRFSVMASVKNYQYARTGAGIEILGRTSSLVAREKTSTLREMGRSKCGNHMLEAV